MEKYFLLLITVILFTAAIYLLLNCFPGKSKEEHTWPRLFGWVPITTLLFVGLYFVSPEQAQVVYYKFALVIAAAFLGYWIDRVLFPYSRPDGYLKQFWQHGTDEPIGRADHEVADGYKNVFAFAMLRRAAIIIAVVLGATLGM